MIEIKQEVTPREIRIFGLLWLAFLGAVGGMSIWNLSLYVPRMRYENGIPSNDFNRPTCWSSSRQSSVTFSVERTTRWWP